MKNKLFILTMIFAKLSFGQNLNGNWTIKGPVAFPTDISGQINGIGRISQIKFHPSNSQKIYAVSASGGLWITNNAGLNWTKTQTDFQIPQGSCSSICIDYTNDNIMYLSTGDANYYYPEYGIYKTTDGGITWQPSHSGIGSLMAIEILMSPNDHNILIAATNNGIWKSIDAGNTWSVKKVSGKFKDMEYKPASANIVYAITDNQFWKSINDGETWIRCASINPTVGNGGRLTTTVANPEIVYAGFVGGSSNGGDGGIIYKSTDSGNTFILKKANTTPNLNGYTASEEGQGDYNWDIFADRNDANTLYACGHIVWKSTDSGTSWTKLTNWWENCHTDMHQILSSPYNSSLFYNVNDGGIFVSDDMCNNWLPKSDGLSATEIYHMGQSKLTRDIVTIGTQDNGALYFDGNLWYCNMGGDSTTKTSFDYANPSTTYYHVGDEIDGVMVNSRRELISNGDLESVGLTNPNNLDNYVFTDQNTSLGLVSQSISLKRTINLLETPPTWNTVSTFASNIKSVAISPTNSNEIYVVLDNGGIYYTSNGNTFSNISNTPNSVSSYCNIQVNKNNTNILYMSCNDNVYKSMDKAVTWTDITGSTNNLNIISLIMDPYKTDESVYIATAYGVYYKNNTLTEWVNFSTGLPLIAQITDLFGYFDGTINSNLKTSFYGRGVWESGLYSSTLSTNQFSTNTEPISIYPNPGTDIITVNVSQPELMNTNAILLDLTGKEINKIEINQPLILLDFSKYQKGVYILKFNNNIIKKIIVK